MALGTLIGRIQQQNSVAITCSGSITLYYTAEEALVSVEIYLEFLLFTWRLHEHGETS